MRPLWIAVLLLAVPACSTYRDDLARGQRAFEQNQHERALALFRALEPDTSHLSPAEQASYAYLRGMTDYRIGYKADARHWLLVAKALDEQNPGTLATDWRGRLDVALKDLNAQVFANGIESLANVKPRGEPSDVKKAKPEPTEATPSNADEDDEDAPRPKRKPKKPIEDE
jgi:hypothetical protein